MRFFWILMITTIVSVILYVISSKGLELIILLLVIDFIALWTSSELGRRDMTMNLKEKIENLERLTYKLFNKLTEKTSNNKEEGKELIQWLDKF